MKKTLISFCLIASCAIMLTSCYSSTTCVGMTPNEPSVEVNRVHNNHFIYGIVGRKTVEAKKYVKNTNKFKTAHQISFVDGLLECITCGIYTPSTTIFYEPAK